MKTDRFTRGLPAPTDKLDAETRKAYLLKRLQGGPKVKLHSKPLPKPLPKKELTEATTIQLCQILRQIIDRLSPEEVVAALRSSRYETGRVETGRLMPSIRTGRSSAYFVSGAPDKNTSDETNTTSIRLSRRWLPRV